MAVQLHHLFTPCFNIEMNKIKIVETSLVLTTGFIGLYFIFKLPVFIIIALLFGLIGIFIPFLARYIAIAWFKLADGLNFIVTKIVFGLVFFIVLVPVAFFYNLSGKDKLSIKNKIKSNWIKVNKKYVASDIENIW